MNNKVSKTEYMVVFDVYTTGNAWLIKCKTETEARKFADDYNRKYAQSSGYGNVHVERWTHTKEVL